MKPSERVDQALKALGVPIDGCAVLKPGRALEPAWHVVTQADGTRVRIDYQASATAAQRASGDAAAIALDLSQAGLDAGERQRSQDIAAALLSAALPEWRALRAALLTALDEINVLRQRDRDRSADIAAATSLANLQTRWAARPALADRTPTQLKAALAARNLTSDAD